MNGGTLTKIVIALTTAAVMATATLLWSLNERVTILDQRMTNLLSIEERIDREQTRRLDEIDRQLRK